MSDPIPDLDDAASPFVGPEVPFLVAVGAEAVPMLSDQSHEGLSATGLKSTQAGSDVSFSDLDIRGALDDVGVIERLRSAASTHGV